jgi:hypothetical protein
MTNDEKIKWTVRSIEVFGAVSPWLGTAFCVFLLYQQFSAMREVEIHLYGIAGALMLGKAAVTELLGKKK